MTSSLPLKLLPADVSTLAHIKNREIKEEQVQIGTIENGRTSVPGKNPKVCSSVYGRLRTVVLFFPTNGAYSFYPYFEFVEELILRLKGGRRRFLLIAEYNMLSQEQCEILYTLARRSKHQFEYIPIAFHRSDLAPWAQDSFLSITYEKDGTRETYLVEPFNQSRNKNAAKELVAFLRKNKINSFQLNYINSHFPFVGGNVLTTDCFTLIGINGTDEMVLQTYGKDWLGKNIILLQCKNTDLYNYWVKCEKTEDGYCNVYEGSAKGQAIFHLDIFITLAGKNKNNQEVLVIGEPQIGFGLTDEISNDIKELVRRMITETSKAINETIEIIEAKLVDLEVPFQIVRNPLPLTYYDEIKGDEKKRYWCWATYNNCLVEHYYSEEGLDPAIIKTIVMPSYGINSDYSSRKCKYTEQKYGSWTDLHIYDLQNRWIWESLGYDVILMQQDYNPFIKRQGSLNCLTNCIERE